MSRPQYGEVVYGWVFTLIPKGAVRGLGSEGGITHTRAWTHTLTQVRAGSAQYLRGHSGQSGALIDVFGYL